jgi:hypothetical protein
MHPWIVTASDESEASDRRIEPQCCRTDNQEPKMNRYDPRTPRTLIGFAAAAMAAATLAIAVLAPAGMEYVANDVDVLTQIEDTTCTGDGAVAAMSVVAVRGVHAVPIVQSRATAKVGMQG